MPETTKEPMFVKSTIAGQVRLAEPYPDEGGPQFADFVEFAGKHGLTDIEALGSWIRGALMICRAEPGRVLWKVPGQRLKRPKFRKELAEILHGTMLRDNPDWLELDRKVRPIFEKWTAALAKREAKLTDAQRKAAAAREALQRKREALENDPEYVEAQRAAAQADAAQTALAEADGVAKARTAGVQSEPVTPIEYR